MTRVDLDAVQARYEQAADLNGAHELAPHNYRDLRHSWSDVPALVAELRAAREVVEASRATAVAARSGKSWFVELAKLLVAIEVYDQAVSS